MKTIRLLFYTVICFFAFVTAMATESGKHQSRLLQLTKYVDPRIGTSGHGHVFLGANVPFGFVQLGPMGAGKGWDWCSGYHDSDSILLGFSHLHISGTGIGDLGDILLFPSMDGKQQSHFSHDKEVIKPGYYSVVLDDSGIQAELTTTTRVGFHRYTYPRRNNVCMSFNIYKGIGSDKFVSGNISQINSTTLVGYRESTGWAKHQKVFFKAVFSSPIKLIQSVGDTLKMLSFDLPANHQLLVKVALSPVSIKNAASNLDIELPLWNFTQTCAKADAAWNVQLSKIDFQSADSSLKKVFYTSLYHTMIAPSVFSDVNGEYYGADGKIHQAKGFTNYTTFSLWDTYRAAHPLSTLIHRDMLTDYAQTFLHIFNQQGRLPVWHLMGNETDCMVGYPAVPVLADLILKGVSIDRLKAFDAMKSTAMLDGHGLKDLKDDGYLPYDKFMTVGSVAWGLEYALSDWCIAQVAKSIGKEDDYQYFIKRSKNYSKYFDSTTKFMRGRAADGHFRSPFNPFLTEFFAGDFVEGNSWQYTWLVPQDVHGLISLMGGEQHFTDKLDSLFIVRGDMGGDAPLDVSGLIGQYAHGNEPSHHIIYMYSYAGKPWKAAPLLRQVIAQFYTTNRDGLAGNEDVGQMSAWYVLSSLGLYQVEPAGGKFVFGSPVMDKATLNVEGRTFTILAHQNSADNKYIQKVRLNDKDYTKSYIEYKDIIAGGVLEFFMGDKPSVFGTDIKDRP